MESPIDSQAVIEVNSVYIKQGQLHGDNAFVAIDTEWGLGRWGHGPDGHITEFGAAAAKDTALETDQHPPPPRLSSTPRAWGDHRGQPLAYCIAYSASQERVAMKALRKA
jgi:hypothetical protein